MKTYLYLPLLVLVISCTRKSASASNGNNNDSIAVIDKAKDTLVVGSKTFYVYSMDKSPFSPLPPADIDSAEQKVIGRDGPVKRLKNTLVLTLDNGKNVSLVNKPDGNDEDFTMYKYTGYIPDIKQYGVYCGYYESSGFLLVSKATGEKIKTWGTPVVSPDKKYFICPSFDLEVGYVPNGFQLFSNMDGKITPIGAIELQQWGPGQMKWIDNKTVVAEALSYDSNMKEISHTIKMVMQ